MEEVLVRPAPVGTEVAVGEAAARRALRAQIARLERDLCAALADGLRHGNVVTATAPAPAHRRRPAARLLDLGALERQRDELSGRVAAARRVLAARAEEEERARIRLERMLLAPGRHRFERVAAAELGEGGCGVYHVRPRLGLVGMLAGWWHVKLSSGCPLATAPPGRAALYPHSTMGRRSRKRSSAGAPPRDPDAPAPPVAAARTAHRPPSRRARLDEAPPAPWSPFPLVELTILLGIVLTVLGAFNLAGERLTFIVCGIALIYLATLELSLREHFAGFRSHSSLLAGVLAIVVAVPLGRYTSIPFEVIGGISLLIFGAAFFALRAAFRRRTGGIGFRV